MAMKIEQIEGRLLLKKPKIIDPLNETETIKDVMLVDGKIEEIGIIEAGNDINFIDCDGLILTHGFCDLHVHFRDPGNGDKETMESGCESALAGGFTRVCTMPNTEPPIDSPELISYIIENTKKMPVHVHPIGSVTKGQAGSEISEMGLMIDSGAVAFSDDGLPIQNGLVMRKALEYSKMFNVPIINHAEDDCLRANGLMNEGIVSTKLGLSGNPNIAESIMVFRDLKLAELTGAQLHVPHVSTAESVQYISDMKNQYNEITAEVTPHHLFYTDEALYDYDTNFKVAPPIRDIRSRWALIQGIKDGIIDCIATDHAPHTSHDKDTTFDLASCGLIGLESCLGVVKKVLVDDEDLGLMEMIKLLTVSPRKIMGFDNDLLKEGKEAELVLFNEEKKWVFNKNDINSKSKNSPFIDAQLSGKVIHTISKGVIATN
ncbi:dihydroorotase [bacterium]|nr:MAG: dihydroorotase [bacterium]